MSCTQSVPRPGRARADPGSPWRDRSLPGLSPGCRNCRNCRTLSDYCRTTVGLLSDYCRNGCRTLSDTVGMVIRGRTVGHCRTTVGITVGLSDLLSDCRTHCRTLSDPTVGLRIKTTQWTPLFREIQGISSSSSLHSPSSYLSC